MLRMCRMAFLFLFLAPVYLLADQLPVRNWPSLKRTATGLIKPRSILVYQHKVGKQSQIDVWRVISVHSDGAQSKPKTIVCAERLFVAKPVEGKAGRFTFNAIREDAPAEERYVVTTINPVGTFVPVAGRTFRSLALELDPKQKISIQALTLPEFVFKAVARHSETILDRRHNNPTLATFNVRGERTN